MNAQNTLFSIVLAVISIITPAYALSGESFIPTLVTSRITMFDQDKTVCQTYYNGFILGGPKYPIIGVGEYVWKGGNGCNQCLQVEYNGKHVVAMAADWHSTLEPKQLDMAQSLLGKLGLDPNSSPSDPSAFKVTLVSCGVSPELNLGGTLRYIFGPGSKDTSLEMVILGNYHPIVGLTATINKVSYIGKRDAGKFKFYGFRLFPNSVITFKVDFDNGSSMTENVPIASIVTGRGGDVNFFKSGTTTTDTADNNSGYINPAVLTWTDYVDGKMPQPLQ